MADAFKCDSCGEYQDRRPTLTVFVEWQKGERVSVEWQGIPPRTRPDLCNKCLAPLFRQAAEKLEQSREDGG